MRKCLWWWTPASSKRFLLFLSVVAPSIFMIILTMPLVMDWDKRFSGWSILEWWWWRRRNEEVNACPVGIYSCFLHQHWTKPPSNYTLPAKWHTSITEHEALIASSTVYICGCNVVMNTWHEREWWPSECVGTFCSRHADVHCYRMLNDDEYSDGRPHCYLFFLPIFCPFTYSELTARRTKNRKCWKNVNE